MKYYLLLPGIFFLDCFAPLGYAVYFFYLIPLMLTLRLPHQRNVLMMAVACSGLTVLGFFGSSEDIDPTVETFNRSVGIAVIWAITNLVLRHDQAKEIIRKKRDFSDALLESLPGIFYLFDENLHFLRWNKRFEQVAGYTAAEIARLSPLDLFAGTDKELVAARMQEVFTKGKSDVNADFVAKDGTHKPYYFTGLCTYVEEKRCLIGIGIDVSEHKQTEIQLRRLNRALKTLSAGNAAVVRARQEQDLLQNICRLLVETGSYRFAWIGCAEQDEHKTVRPLSKAGHEDGYLESVTFTWADNKLGQGPAGTAIRTGQTQVARDIATNPNYTPWRAEAMKRGYASIIAIPLCEKGRPFGALIAYSKEPDDFDENEVALLQELAQDLEYGIMALRSLTELTQMADKLRTSSDYARSLIEASLDPLGTINTDGKITDVNTAAEAITGLPRERLIGSDFWTYFTEPDKAREVYPQVLAQGVVRDYPLTIRHASGRLMDVLYNATVYRDNKGAVQGVLATARDITERKRMEEQAARVEHLATLGKLLSGIAHEIKNPLFVMTGRVQLLKEKLANREYDASAQDISIIENAGKRMTEITQRFLNIARPLKPQWQRCSVHDVLAQLLEFIANELMKNRIQVVRAFAPDVPETWSEPRQLHQVFLNLILNAMQAIAAARGQGTLTITTGRENDSIIIRIQDDGPGIAPQNRVRLFEPFFSTKPPEQGTGLGLWTVRSTLTELNGTVQCESEEGEGATFIVSIPIVSHPSKE
jgi:PAS domain S-box-containing protein